MQDVAGHVAQRTRAEIPPAAEIPRGIDRVVGTHRRRPDEGVPVERFGHALVVFGTHQPLRPDRAVGEGLNLAHLADFAVPYPFADLAHAFGRSALVAHLRGYLVLGGQFGQQTRFVDRVRQRFLAIDVLAGRNGVGRDDRVGVVGRSHHDRIGRFEHLVVHAAVIVVAFGRGVTLEDMLRVFPVDVAQADDVLAFKALQYRSAATADADTQDIEFVAGRGMPEFLTQNRAGYDRQPDCGGSPLFQEASSRHFFCHRSKIYWVRLTIDCIRQRVPAPAGETAHFAGRTPCTASAVCEKSPALRLRASPPKRSAHFGGRAAVPSASGRSAGSSAPAAGTVYFFS